MDSTAFFGTGCQNGLLPALVRPPLAGAVQQPAMTLKQLLPLAVDGSALSLFPGFSSLDPVQKAVLNHTLGLSSSTKRKHVSCTLCQLRFNSQSQALAHYKGTKHAKKLKALDPPKSRLKGPVATKDSATQELASISTSPAPDSSPTQTPEPEAAPSEEPPEPDLGPEAGQEEAESEEDKARRLLYCSLCKVAVNSSSQLDAHNSGTKHKTMLEARSGLGSIKSFPRAAVKARAAPGPRSTTGLQDKTFFCQICDVHVNSETQLKQHISSRRHKDRAAGKPTKPKYNPYSKPPKSRQSVKLSLGKDMPPLSPAPLLPAHLAAVAAAVAMGNSFPHRSSPASGPAPSSALFQHQPLPPSLLRPAPGPVRTSHHSSILFSPY